MVELTTLIDHTPNKGRLIWNSEAKELKAFHISWENTLEGSDRIDMVMEN